MQALLVRQGVPTPAITITDNEWIVVSGKVSAPKKRNGWFNWTFRRPHFHLSKCPEGNMALSAEKAQPPLNSVVLQSITKPLSELKATQRPYRSTSF
jgi:hypothetical protein